MSITYHCSELICHTTFESQLFAHHFSSIVIPSFRTDPPCQSWHCYSKWTISFGLITLQELHTYTWRKDMKICSYIHYATHDTRLTHSHRKFRLAEDFEMLRLAPDFETLRLTCDFKTLRQTPMRCPPDATFQNIAPEACQTPARRNILKSGVRRNISKSCARHYILWPFVRRAVRVWLCRLLLHSKLPLPLSILTLTKPLN